MATPEQVVRIVTILDAMYPKDVAFLTEDQAAARVATYARLLADMDADALCLAVDQYIAGGGASYPTVKQLRDMALSMAQAADDAPDAATAWRQACNALEPWIDGAQFRAGVKDKLHPRVLRAIEVYGARRIVLREDGNAGTDFAQWRGLYESLAHRADEQARWLPQVRERIHAMRAEMDARKPAQIEAPAMPEDAPRVAGGGMMKLSDVLGSGATTQPTKAELDRRAHAALLIARRELLQKQLAGERDADKRRALLLTIDGITRSVAQYEVQP